MSRSTANPNTVTLYRPVGQAELDLIAANGYRRFPPRLPEQPIFYPVCNEEYAVEIAERWNARDEGVGYVTRFSVLASHLESSSGRSWGLAITLNTGSRPTSWTPSTMRSSARSRLCELFAAIRQELRDEGEHV